DTEEAEFDLAVINNSAATLHTVDFIVTFARRDAGGRRRNLIERGLHWPADLAPGASVKWDVEAKGTEFKVDGKITGKLGESGIGPAPADAFAQLRNASLVEVRMHAAMMLAYLRDGRAADMARTLAGTGAQLSALEEKARNQILGTLEPLQICDVKVAADGVDACLYNGTNELHRGMVVHEVGAEQPRRWTVNDKFLPGHGLRARITTGSKRPTGFRLEAAR
ncbi:MAG TPA: hypothetical protein VFB62_04000, partial [Polyangiaceae bacterium]|nr:hypothetical protein [Polyangiaceae bacterium]